MLTWKNRSCFPVNILLVVLVLTTCVLGEDYSVTKTLAGPEWNYLDRPSPKTYWGLWQPPLNQMGIRYRFGVRPSLLTINLRCPVEITVSCNQDQAAGGKTLELKVNAKPTDAVNGKTFDSNFGASFPTQAQYGFFSCDLIPDILPWRDLPVDMWGCVAMIPKYGSTIVSAVENVSVGMQSENALPLGDTPANYADPRELISIDLKDFITDAEKAKNPEEWDIAQKIWNKIPSNVKKSVKLAIKVATQINDETAENKAIAYIGKGFEVVSNAGVVALEGHPSWKVTGEELNLLLRVRIPDRASSGVYPLTFTEPEQEQTISFPISPYVSDTDSLEVIVDSATYRFKVEQCLKGHVIFSSAIDLEFGPDPKLADLTQAVKTYDEDEAATFVIPLQACTDILTAFHGKGGRNAIQLWWSSPIVKTKGTIFYRKKNTSSWLNKKENTFKIAHTFFVTGLQNETEYEFKLVAEDTAENEYPTLGPITVSTTDDAHVDFTKDKLTQGNALAINKKPTVNVNNGTATLNWETNVNASTEVFLSPLNTFELYTSAIKHENEGVSVSGINSVSGDRELVTKHNISIPNLEPGMTYYFAARSWTFEDDDPSKDGLAYVHSIGNFTIDPLPESPSIRIKVQSGSNPVENICVTSKQNGNYPLMTWTTGSDGRTEPIPVEPGGSYTFAVTDHPCYIDKSTQKSFNNSAHGEQSTQTLSLTRKTRPQGGYVLDLDGNPVKNASINMVGKNCTTTSNTTGYYAFTLSEVENAGLSAGDTVELKITKTGYLEYKNTVTANTDCCGYLTAETCLLTGETVPVTITIKKMGDVGVSGASVVLERSNTNIELPQTNSQGISSLSIPYGSLTTTVPNALVKKYTLTVTPPEDSKLQAVTLQNVELAAGENLVLELYLPPIPPVYLEDLAITNTGSGIKANVYFSEVSKSFIKCITPDGESETRPWTSSATDSFSWQISNKTPGLYTFTIEAQNVLGGDVSTFGPFEHLRWSAGDWNLSVTPNTHDTITVQWNAFPAISTFSHYILTIEGQTTPVSIDDRDIVKHVQTNLQGLIPGNKKTVTIQAIGQDNAILAEGTATFTAVSKSPVIEEFTIEPVRVAVGQQVTLNALVTDPDSNIRKYQVKAQDKEAEFEEQLIARTCNDNNLQIEETFALERAGKCEVTFIVEDELSRDAKSVKLEVLDIKIPGLGWKESPPSRIEATEPCPVTLGIEGDREFVSHTEIAIDWGDGNEQICSPEMIKKADMQPTFSHVYQEGGNFNITMTPVFRDGTVYMTGDTLKKRISVKVNQPKVRLLDEGKTNKRIFNLDIEAGTFPISLWTLDFGDSKNMEGTGMPPKQVIHYYPPNLEKRDRKKYEATLSIVDTKGNEVNDSEQVTVPAGSQELPPASGEGLQPVNESRPTTEGDLSITCTIPDSARTGETIRISAQVSERGKKAVPRTAVVLSINGRETERKTIQIKERQTTEIDFNFEVPSSERQIEVQLQIIKPSNFLDTNSNNDMVKKTVSIR